MDCYQKFILVYDPILFPLLIIEEKNEVKTLNSYFRDKVCFEWITSDTIPKVHGEQKLVVLEKQVGKEVFDVQGRKLA